MVYAKLLEGINPQWSVKEKGKVSRALEIDDVALVFKDGEDEYICSPVGDIQNCKYTMMPRFFGNKRNRYSDAQNVKDISLEENREIDRVIEYIPNSVTKQDDEKVEDSYADIVFKEIAEEVKNTQMFKHFLAKQGIEIPEEKTEEEIEKVRDLIVSEKVKTITQLIKWKNSKNVGTNEMKQFYIKLFQSATFNKDEKSRFRTYDFFKQEGESIDIIRVIELMLNTGPIYYVYSNEDHTYVFITHTELKETINGYSERKNRKLLIDEEFEKGIEK